MTDEKKALVVPVILDRNGVPYLINAESFKFVEETKELQLSLITAAAAFEEGNFFVLDKNHKDADVFIIILKSFFRTHEDYNVIFVDWDSLMEGRLDDSEENTLEGDTENQGVAQSG